MPRDGSLVAKAGEMVLGGFGFIMHHELAHVRLGHAGGPDTQWTLDQEKDADAFMTAVRLSRLAQGASPTRVENQTHPATIRPYGQSYPAPYNPGQ